MALVCWESLFTPNLEVLGSGLEVVGATTNTIENKLCYIIIMFTGSINQLCLLYVTGFMGSLIMENKLCYNYVTGSINHS